ncbi:MAG: AAA family ATPase [Lachnospiraceae bacterium]
MRIASRDVPPSLLGTQIYALDLALLVAGTKFRGEFEERIKGIVSEAQERGNVILFIDELHTLIGAGGSSEGTLDAANILKPALARGTLRVIGATTYKEYRKYIEKDAALARRFQRIDVREPDKAQTLEILSGLRERYENFHHVEISDEALISAVELSSRYVTDRFMPDKAIDLIDEAASMANVELWKRSEEEEMLENEAVSLPSAVIREDEIEKVIAQWTGVPVERVGTENQQDILTLEERLSSRVIGQNEAVSAIVKSLRRARAGLNDPTRPLGVFMLLGPSGVGKTELCKALSEALFGTEDALIRVDMSEYSEEATASRLIGSPPGYVGYGDGGQLTDAVLKRPYSVVLFDEIEKAHPKIFSLLLQLLDDGQLTDSVGRKVNFKNTVVIMTSNTGVSFEMDKRLGFSGSKTDDTPTISRRRTIMAQAKQTFRPEFLGRIDEMIVMNSLTQEDGAKIAELMLEKVKARLEQQGITLSYDQEVSVLLAQSGVNEMSGARNLRRVIVEQVEDPLSELILRGKAGNEVRLSVRCGKMIINNSCEALAPA